MPLIDGPIGIVGAGAMGLPILRNITQEGVPVVCFDSSKAAADAATAAGATAVASVGELSDCQAVLVFVPNDADVRSVGDAYFAIAKAGAFFVICSSVTTTTCVELDSAARAHGLHVVDAALTGGVRGAEEGRISLLVGGDQADVDALHPIFELFCTKISHLGAIGSGQVGKTVNNLLHWSQIVGLAEALTLGAELGVPVSIMREALRGGPSDSNTMHQLEYARFTWFEKDLANAQTMAAEHGVSLTVAPIVRKLMRQVTIPAMADLLDGKGGITFRLER